MSDNQNIVVPEGEHSRCGPSGAKVWLHCHAQPNALAALPPAVRKAGIAADEGTAAHAVAAMCLMTGTHAWMHGGKTVHVGSNSFTVDEEMVEAVQLYLDTVRNIMHEWEGSKPVMYVETTVSSALDQDAWGSCDTRIEVPGIAIFVLDFKYGKGWVCEPHEPQTKQYGYMAYEGRSEQLQTEEGAPQQIICMIVQPRIPHPEGPVRQHIYEVEEVVDWFIDTCLPAYEGTRDPNATFEVGSWCDGCTVGRTGNCRALTDAYKKFPLDGDAEKMTPEELGDNLEKLEAFISLGNLWKEVAFKRALNGEAIKGKKIVKKKANRIFKDSIVEQRVVNAETGETKEVIVALDDALRTNFGDAAFEPAKAKSPPKVQELPGGKDFVTRWAYKPDTGLTLADHDDPRPAVKPLVDRLLDAPDKVAAPDEVII